MPALDKMRAAGFEVAIAPEDGGLLVRPADRLTDAQRQWVAAHKADLLAALAADAVPTPIPEPIAAPPAVRCIDCRHGRMALPDDEPGAWRLCRAGKGGRFAYQEHYCTAWEATAARESESQPAPPPPAPKLVARQTPEQRQQCFDARVAEFMRAGLTHEAATAATAKEGW